jgi:hypothetical protein
MESPGAERASVEGHTERRTLASSMWQANGLTHEASPRQLPTDHDHDGESQARSANIRVINRRACRLDRRFLCSRITGGNRASCNQN